MENHEIWSERSPRDKSGGFGFENMFWPLVNVARPEAYTGGHAGVQEGSIRVYGRGQDHVWDHVCVVCALMYICSPVSSLLYL